MYQRPLFICSAIEKCRETVNCCPHKKPHLKDERCVPRECRYAPSFESVDCVSYDPANPNVPIPEPVVPIKMVEQRVKEEPEIMDAPKEDVKTPDPEPSQQPVTLTKKSKSSAYPKKRQKKNPRGMKGV